MARELLDTSVKGADDVAEITSAPVLGNIFQYNDAKRAPHEVLTTATPWAEAFRVLRTNMQYVDIDHAQKVFVLTSALPGEGKSTTAVHLAVTLTQAGQRVALVECDLRRPLIADRLELDGAIGTTSVLIGKVSAEDVMQQYADTSLDVMVCGQIPPNPSELLASDRMKHLIAEVREKFAYVIFDSPPVLAVTDAIVLAASADGVVLCVHGGKTPRDLVQRSAERLRQSNIPVLGAILNNLDLHQYGYTYRKSYYDYYDSAEEEQKRKTV